MLFLKVFEGDDPIFWDICNCVNIFSEEGGRNEVKIDLLDLIPQERELEILEKYSEVYDEIEGPRN